MLHCALIRTTWRSPVSVLADHADQPYAFALLSDGRGERGRWSYVARDPIAVRPCLAGEDAFAALADILGAETTSDPDGPPFQGGVIGLCAYELGAAAEGVELERMIDWPDAIFARYDALLAFDHAASEVVAIGRGASPVIADAAAERALTWLEEADPSTPRGPLAETFSSGDAEAYERATLEVVDRIAAGEIFQANIARLWRGRLKDGVRPFDLASRLYRQSPAPFAGYLRLPDAVLVSNSPERFLKVTPDRVIESRPIKGTAPRGLTSAEDRTLSERLSASAKDRAENLMIVDLMRNDLSRVCRPGEVTTPELFAVETFANVHHLVSTVRGGLLDQRGPADVLRATFPPGSITGAPKVQAMKVIAEYEPPRGPFFGSLIWVGYDGAMDANVLIRTALLREDRGGWSIEARAGGGIVAESDPTAERAETEAKIDALRRALLEPER